MNHLFILLNLYKWETPNIHNIIPHRHYFQQLFLYPCDLSSSSKKICESVNRKSCDSEANRENQPPIVSSSSAHSSTYSPVSVTARVSNVVIGGGMRCKHGDGETAIVLLVVWAEERSGWGGCGIDSFVMMCEAVTQPPAHLRLWGKKNFNHYNPFFLVFVFTQSWNLLNYRNGKNNCVFLNMLWVTKICENPVYISFKWCSICIKSTTKSHVFKVWVIQRKIFVAHMTKLDKSF